MPLEPTPEPGLALHERSASINFHPKNQGMRIFILAASRAHTRRHFQRYLYMSWVSNTEGLIYLCVSSNMNAGTHYLRDYSFEMPGASE